MNNKTYILELLKCGLSIDEAKIYLSLLESPKSHLEIARKTGVNRSKVYRVAELLQSRGLISEETNNEGHLLAAADPSNLEITLTTAEEKLKTQREHYLMTLPSLKQLYHSGSQSYESDFVVNTYEGKDGFKQMLWNELKAQKEILIFGYGTIQDLVASPRWAEKHRVKTLEANYKIREILNQGGKPEDFTRNDEFVSRVYVKRYINPKILPLAQQICIYNDTVSIYNWRGNHKVGTEIVNKAFADTQRTIFENYWLIAE